MAQTFGTFKSLVDQRDREAIARTRAAANADDETTPIADAAKLPATNHQERVNAEMFKAIEILGRKIDRAVDEREHLNRRLALIESAATVDEKTGKLYLPVVTDGTLAAPAHTPAPVSAEVPRWMLATTILSTVIAVAALAMVALRPAGPQLTHEQLAILNALAETRMGTLTAPMTGTASDDSWQNIDSADTAADTMPAESALQQPALTPADAPTVADAIAAPETVITGTEQTVVDSGAMTPLPAESVPVAAAPAETTATQSDAPVSLTAAAPAETAPAPAETTTQDTAQEQATAPAVVAPAATEAPAAEAVAAPAPKASLQNSAAEPQALVAGLDIGRDPNLPARLTEVETRAMQGIAAAQHDLATIYAAGQQTTQDYKRAAYWFAQAADAGIANAHYNLGVMFQQGLGLRKDATKAMDWYKKAADLGHPEALYNLGIANIEGVGAARNVDAGITYFTQAADAGVAQASFNLGVLYESGFAGPIDLASARNWYEKASTQGHAEAREALARLDKQMGQAPALTPADMVEPAAGDAPPPAVAPAPQAPAQKKSATSRSNLTAKVQRALIGRGLLPGAAASGKMDARTEDAIRAFQAANNLPVDGKVTEALLDHINQTTR